MLSAANMTMCLARVYLYTLGLAMDIIVSGYVLHSGVKNGWQLLTKK